MDQLTRARFWAKTERTEDGCRVWVGVVSRQGYGRFSIKGRSFRAHRLVYEWAYGPVASELVIDHLCRNRACVNPAHLEAVTHAENVRRGAWANRTHCPQRHEYSPENTYVAKTGWRSCRECHRTKSREWKRARSAGA